VQRKASIYRAVSHAFPYGRLIDVEKPTPTLVAALIVCKTTYRCACMRTYVCVCFHSRHLGLLIDIQTSNVALNRNDQSPAEGIARRCKVNRLLSHVYPQNPISPSRENRRGLIRPLILPRCLIEHAKHVPILPVFDERTSTTTTTRLHRRVYLALLRTVSRFHEITKGRRADTLRANAARYKARAASLKRENDDGETYRTAATMKRDTPLSTGRPYGVVFYFTSQPRGTSIAATPGVAFVPLFRLEGAAGLREGDPKEGEGCRGIPRTFHHPTPPRCTKSRAPKGNNEVANGKL